MQIHRRIEVSASLTQRYAGATRAFLLARLQSEFGTAPGTLTGGGPRALEACPCCGRKAIGERGNDEICKVCWGEDLKVTK